MRPSPLRAYTTGFCAACACVASLAPSPALGQMGPSVDGRATAAPRVYDARRTATPPDVDGRLTDEAWSAAPWTKDFLDIRGEGWPTPAWRTRAKLLWDARYLYVAAELEEPHLWATLTDRDAIVYHDHDFEIFLDPDGDGLAYFEFEINALGTEFDLFLDRPYDDGGHANIAWNMPGLRSAVWLDGTLNDPSDTDRGWSVEVAIPWEDLRAPGDTSPETTPRLGDAWRVNFSRVEWPLLVEEGMYRKDAGATAARPHPEDNWVWSPQGVVNMHKPERWGVVRFVSEPDRG
jgi:Carbohydrate family 9 binding domain-like